MVGGDAFVDSFRPDVELEVETVAALSTFSVVALATGSAAFGSSCFDGSVVLSEGLFSVEVTAEFVASVVEVVEVSPVGGSVLDDSAVFAASAGFSSGVEVEETLLRGLFGFGIKSDCATIASVIGTLKWINIRRDKTTLLMGVSSDRTVSR